MSAARRPARRPARGRGPRLLRDFVPPEGVPIRLEVAGLGARLAAQVIDIVVTLLVLVAVMLILFLGLEAPESLLLGVGAALFFFIRAPYYIVTELFWNGQTLGKRMTGIRVIATDGRGLDAHAVAARNLMKEMEIFAPGTAMLAVRDMDAIGYLALGTWIAVLLAVPLFNREHQRIGDLIAGTCVVVQPPLRLLPDIAAAATVSAATQPEEAAEFAFLPHHLGHYGDYELQTLERLLRAQTARGEKAAAARAAQVQAVAERIRSRIEYAGRVEPERAEDFLRAFYAAQRAELERGRLFGRVRADRHSPRPGAGA
ncbi:RDD family protein [Oceanicella sp. SM1341]|uniref:RDD family protein n=1 Tax=Oceanicella sp. SM1341 TaxID=1548889 RepID=UPI000E46A82F|nr:RDD family protein [Oceanicella sp. SM1341]